MPNAQNSGTETMTWKDAKPAANVPNLTPRNLQEAIDFCERLAKTNFVPKDYQGKPSEILAAIQFGAEVGLGPMQSLQSIAVINGRPSLWGDAMLGLVQGSGLLEWIHETETADSATCQLKRKGDKQICAVTFTHADAVKAGLANKPGPWQQYPKRMRQMRARGFALRSKFADVLKGLISREEAQDYPPVIESLSEDEAALKIVRDKGPFEATGETIVEDKPGLISEEEAKLTDHLREPKPDAPPTEQEVAELAKVADSLLLNEREIKRALTPWGVTRLADLKDITRPQLIAITHALEEAAQ